MSTRFSSAQNFHPEFGYLCPTATMRRKVRRGAMMVMAGVVIAASTGLALVPRSPGDGDRKTQAPSVLTVAQPTNDVPRVTTAQPMPVTGPAGALRTQLSCDDISGSFLVAKCQPSESGKPRSARGIIHRVATVSIGRVVMPEAEPQNVTAVQPVQAAATPAAQAMAAANEAPAPGKLVAPTNKPVKTTRKPARSRDNDGVPATAVVPPPLSLPGLFGLFRNSMHVAARGFALLR